MDVFSFLSKNQTMNSIIDSDSCTVGSSTTESNITLIVMDYLKNKRGILVVLPNLFMAQKYYDEIINVLDEECILFYPADELLTATLISSGGDFKYERINTLKLLIEDSRRIVITHLNGLIKYQLPKRIWEKNIFKLSVNDTIDIKELTKRLVSIGYEHTFTTIKTGQFSKRGSIVDIFPLNAKEPVRLDFFGDTIETMKHYDVDSQRSISNVESIEIIPTSEVIYSEADIPLIVRKMEGFMEENKLSTEETEKLNSDILSIEDYNNLDMLTMYLSFISEEKATILDFIDNPRIYVVDKPKVDEIYNSIILDLNEYCETVKGYSIFKLDYFASPKVLDERHYVSIEGLRSIGHIDYYINAKEVTPFNADERKVVADFRMYMGVKTVFCFISDQTHLKTFKNSLLDNHVFFNEGENNIQENQINIIEHAYLPSFELAYDNSLFINEKTIFEKAHNKRKIKYKSIYSNATKISRYDELVVGDYVVHYDHGVGKYLGITSMETNGIVRDFIHLEYNKGGALYIPVEQVNSLMKYASKEVDNVKLNTIGGADWARAKQKVKAKINDISEKLIKLYASREASVGYAFSPDNEVQEEFEKGFPYELTYDQEKAVVSVKRDMERGKPMDRLICGDVGYGKTEVALRAAFKAVYDGKQVAMLAPTTILARQHYHSFKERMESFGIRVELLSRFVPQRIQKDVIAGLLTGEVSVVIGTHRLLSNEIVFKDLGLLIVDEEQRFGVTHKERIKEMKVNVDAITLSATPIPRTLQMSIIGIKDLSMIETPPKNRYPIQTYVLQRNDAVIREAIERELARDGQVFYLYNRVDTITDMANHIHNLVPTARICIGHGKMDKNELEDMLCKFIDHEYDILVCTTIIETGIDMPETNTLIIHEADTLGLSQLYQIRGRVGRSNKIAYAYLMYEPRKILNDIAEKRLATIKEFNELGSGFKIAMKDLAIRGAGDILGAEQSGFIDTVGIDMYMKLLEECLNEQKGILPEPKKEIDTSLKVPLASQHIEASYIDNEDVRIEVHKKIDLIETLRDLNNLYLELVDRFGSVDTELEEYMYDKLLHKQCERLDIYRINTSVSGSIAFHFTKAASNKLDGNKLFTAANSVSKLIHLTYIREEVRIVMEITKFKDKSYLKMLCHFFNAII